MFEQARILYMYKVQFFSMISTICITDRKSIYIFIFLLRVTYFFHPGSTCKLRDVTFLCISDVVSHSDRFTGESGRS